MKILKGVFLLLIVLVVLFAVGKNIIVKAGVEQGVKLVTGLPLKMARLDISFMKTYVKIDGLELQNPAGFPDPMMVNIPEIFVDYDLPALMKKKVRLYEVRLNLKEFVVVKNQEGELNLDALKALQPEAPAGETKTPVEKQAAEMPEIQIDVLKLQVGKVVFKDYSKGGKPAVSEFQVGLNEEMKNITDPNALVRSIVLRTLMKTPIANLTNFDMEGLKNSVTGTVGAAKDLATGAVGTAKDLTTGAVGAAGDTLKKTTEGITNVIKLPFGQK